MTFRLYVPVNFTTGQNLTNIKSAVYLGFFFFFFFLGGRWGKHKRVKQKRSLNEKRILKNYASKYISSELVCTLLPIQKYFHAFFLHHSSHMEDKICSVLAIHI